MKEDLLWAKLFQRRCVAVLEPTDGCPDSGRCELRMGHRRYHAMLRGLHEVRVVRWSTRVLEV